MMSRRGTFWLWLIASSLTYGWLGYGQERSEFASLLGAFGLVFAGYLMAVQNDSFGIEQNLLLAGGLFRLIFLVAVPALSDDYVRFVWDGRWLAEGDNPYLILPTDYPTRDLFAQLNSPGYFTVYPPLNQFVFGLGAWLFPTNLLGHVVVMRIIIIGAELGTIALMRALLRRNNQPTRRVLLYALNPLVVVELTGNLHFEGLGLFFLLLALFWLETEKPRLAALSWGLSVAVKLIPLLFLPVLIRWVGWGKAIFITVIVVLLNIGLFGPFLNAELLANFTSSLNLYFQKFEFNASIYYLVREAGYWWKGYNIIQKAGPWLLAIAAAGIGYLALRRGAAGTFPWSRVLFMHTLYLALATTVHPWYLTYLIAFAIFTPFRYPFVWSATVVISYATYAHATFQENLWLTGSEYLLVYGCLFWELRRQASIRWRAA